MKELTKEIAIIFGFSYVVGLLSSIYHLSLIGLPLFPTNIFLSINELFYGAIMVLLAIVTAFTSLSIINSHAIQDANKWLELSSYNKSKPFFRRIAWFIRFIMTLQIYLVPYIVISFISVAIITNFNIKSILNFYWIYFFNTSGMALGLYRSIKGLTSKDDEFMVGRYASILFGFEKIGLINSIVYITLIASVYSFVLNGSILPIFGGGMPVKVIPYLDECYKENILFNDDSKLDGQGVYLIGQSLEYIAFSKFKDIKKSNVLFIRRDKLIALKNDKMDVTKDVITKKDDTLPK